MVDYTQSSSEEIRDTPAVQYHNLKLYHQMLQVQNENDLCVHYIITIRISNVVGKVDGYYTVIDNKFLHNVVRKPQIQKLPASNCPQASKSDLGPDTQSSSEEIRDITAVQYHNVKLLSLPPNAAVK